MFKLSIITLLVLATTIAHGYQLQYVDKEGAKYAYKDTLTASYKTDTDLPADADDLNNVKFTEEYTVVETVGMPKYGGMRIDVVEYAHDRIVNEPNKAEYKEEVEQKKNGYIRLTDGLILKRIHFIDGEEIESITSQSKAHFNFGFCSEFRFPNRDMKVGDSWIADFTSSDMRLTTFPMKTTYKITEEKIVNGRKCLMITTAYSQKKAMEAKYPLLSYDITVRSSAAALWDIEAGELLSNTIHTIINRDQTVIHPQTNKQVYIKETDDISQTRVRIPVPAGV